ncbi:MAG: hypothetical protein R2755_08005 [Acidimicrobiales bacterium]
MDQQGGQPWPPPPGGVPGSWGPPPRTAPRRDAGPGDGAPMETATLLGGLASLASLLPGLGRLAATAVATTQRDVPAAWANSGWLAVVQLLLALLGAVLCAAGFARSQRRGAGVAAALFVAGAALGWAVDDAGYWAVVQFLA